MKDLISKLTNLEATAPKAPAGKKMLTEDSVGNETPKKPTFKDVFNQLSETVQPGQKPLPVMDPANKQAGMGFVTSKNTAVQNMLKNLDPKDVQIVQAPGQQTTTQPTTQQSAQPAPAGATGQQPAGQQQMKEKWAGDVKLNPAKKGMFKGKTKAELEKQLAALHKSGPHKKGSPEYTKQQELNFAIRAKGGWKESEEVAEGAKVDRMVKHIEKSERKLGKSKEQASDIAWATANKRGMLDNKNKKKTNEDIDQEIADLRKTINSRKGRVYTPNHPEKKETEQLRRKLDKLVKSKEVKEADIPSTAGVDTKGAGLGAGRSQTTLEGKKDKIASMPVRKFDATYGKKKSKDADAPTKNKPAPANDKKVEEGKKPDFLDLDKDGNKKESMKKAAADKKKKKVDESMNHRISAARLEGKSHGLKGHAHCGKSYEDLEERRAYHEGYVDGLDECYGMGVYEDVLPATTHGMADQGMHDGMDEGNAFTAALARTPKGGKFSVGGKTFTDHSSYDSSLDETGYAFESWSNQLNNLLNEGLSVSVSKGQQNSPDSVTITAQDAEADQLLQLVKHAGLGLFGDEASHEPSAAMSVQPSHGDPDEVGAGGVDIDVVDGHDGIMGLMQKITGIQSSGHDEDYADEEGDELHSHDEDGEEEHTCNECGMMETQCGCDKEQVDEVESEDQMTYKMAENAPETDAQADEDAEAKEDQALATSDKAEDEEDDLEESFAFESLLSKLNSLTESKDEEDEEEDSEEETDESKKLDEWANGIGKDKAGKGTDAQFEQDIDFMTKVIAGGLNKPKSTGQTTIPVVAGQVDRMVDSPTDWATLAGIKKA